MSKYLIYVSYKESSASPYLKKTWLGVEKKIKYQLKQIETLGYQTKRTYYKRNLKSSFIDSINPFYSCIDWKKVKIDGIPDAAYIRLGYIEFGLIKFLANLKKKNKNMKIILELPTYPFKGEIPKSIYIKSCIFRKFLSKYVDRILLSAPGYKKLFGIKVLYVPNSVDYNEEFLVSSANKNDEEIHLIAVSTMQFWHGYDRLIKGMNLYYKKNNNRKKVILHLVGGGAEENTYKKLVKKYHLDKYVIFEGFLEGKELDSVYEQCHIAVGSLGIHRIDNKLKVSSLKLKEYVAHGLPVMIAGYSDIICKETKKYILGIADDETFISIERIVDFYESLYEDKNVINLHEKIRIVFKKTCDINYVFKPVLKFLEN